MHSEGDYQPVLRDFRLTDLPLVMSAWVRAQVRDPRMDPDLFDQAFHDRAKARLVQSTCRVLCFKDDPDLVVGFIVYDEDTLHFVHVKSFYRRMGFARKLLDLAGPKPFHSCLTEKMDVLKLKSQFNPFTL